MKAYYKVVADGFITGIGTNGSDDATEITKKEYNAISALISDKPIAQDGYKYVLKDSTKEWVLIEAPVPPSEISDSEALAIIMGGVS